MFGIRKKNKPASKMWGEFYGKNNSDDVIKNKASASAPIFVELSHASRNSLKEYFDQATQSEDVAEDLLKILNNITPQKWNNIMFEYLFLYINVTDRQAFHYLGETQRAKFMDSLFLDIIESLKKGFSKRDIIPFATEQLLIEVYNERQHNYSHYESLIPEKDESPQDTVFWEFGKFIAKIISGEPNDVRIVLPAMNIAIENYFSIEIPQLLTGKKV